MTLFQAAQQPGGRAHAGRQVLFVRQAQNHQIAGYSGSLRIFLQQGQLNGAPGFHVGRAPAELPLAALQVRDGFGIQKGGSPFECAVDDFHIVGAGLDVRVFVGIHHIAVVH